MELTQQEVMAILGEKELRIAAQAKHIAALQTKLQELQIEHRGPKLKPAVAEVRTQGGELG